jgi:hypothetical protein
MEWVGDLERLVAENLYPLRVPLAILGAAGVVVLVLVARRRGWIAAARRHPIRSIVSGLALVAVLTPVTWYLASPLFIRIELDEPAPALAADEAPAPSPTTVPSPPTQPHISREPVVTPEPTRTAVPLLALEGRFKGEDEFHFGRGRARLLETEPGRYVVRFEDFAVRNGPDLYVYLSPDPDGYARKAIELGRLRATDGSFNVPVPAGADVSNARSVVIWCKQFSVQFAVAELRS